MKLRSVQRRVTCAICVGDIPAGSARFEPLGLNDGLVAVCESCAEDTPIARDREAGYRGGEGGQLSSAEARAAMVKFDGGEEAYQAGIKRRRTMLNKLPPRTPRELVDIRAVEFEGKRRNRTGASSYSSRRSKNQSRIA